MVYTRSRATWQDGSAGGTSIRAVDINNWEAGIEAAHALIPTGNTFYPESYGAVGTGAANDLTALNAAITAMSAGDTLKIRSGKIYRHDSEWTISKSGITIEGPGEIRAATPTASAIILTGLNQTLRGLNVTCPTASSRGGAWEHNGITLKGSIGSRLYDVQTTNAHAAGILMAGASYYHLENCRVINSWADGIHNTGLTGTGGSHHGNIIDCYCEDNGDDNFAVVSYSTSSPATSNFGLCTDINFINPRAYNLTTRSKGRMFSIIGGTRVRFYDIFGTSSFGAGIIVQAEGSPWFSESVNDCGIYGGTIRKAGTINTSDPAWPDGGGIVITADLTGFTVADLDIHDVTFYNTQSTVSREVLVLVSGGGTTARINIAGLRFRGTGPATILTNSGTASSVITTNRGTLG